MKFLPALTQTWWASLVLLVFSILLSYLGLEFRSKALAMVSDWLVLFAFLAVFFSMIRHFVKRKLAWGLVELIVLIPTLLMYATFAMVYPYDFFADDLSIPTDIQNYPAVLPAEPVQLDSLSGGTPGQFNLYDSFQKGLYEYDVWLHSSESGTAYLKAFELTEGTELSAEGLREKSKIRIKPTFGRTRRFGTKTDFTIYEGDWGYPYAARFELWFKPDGPQPERKLLEKNYVIEGWMR